MMDHAALTQDAMSQGSFPLMLLSDHSNHWRDPRMIRTHLSNDTRSNAAHRTRKEFCRYSGFFCVCMRRTL